MSEAYDEGYEKGYHFGYGDNPYDEGSHEYDEWESGFRNGNETYNSDQDIVHWQYEEEG